MTSKRDALLDGLHQFVVESEVALYRKHLLTTGTVAYWQRLSALARKLSDEDRETVMMLVRAVATDSLAMTLGVLANEQTLDGIEHLRLDADMEENINEDLRASYLEKLGPV